MNVCYVFQDRYPWDVRVEKITDSLAIQGWGVHVLSRNANSDPRSEVLQAGVHVHRLPSGWGGVVRRVLNFPAFFSPTWILSILSVLRRHACDAIIVRDLPLSPAAWIAARCTGIPVVMDAAEDYPSMLQDTWRFRGPRPADYVLRNPVLLRKLEAWICPRLNGLFAVSQASANRFARLAGPAVPIWVVGNTPRLLQQVTASSHAVALRMRAFEGLKLLYTGGLEEMRGLDTVLRSAVTLRERGAKFLIVIVGQGSGEAVLRARAHDLGVEEHVLFAGWIPHSELPGVIGAADVCLVPHYVTQHTDTTLPNKLFDYMTQGKPVLVTQARSLLEVVNAAACGRVYCDRDPADLAAAIETMMDPRLRSELGSAARRSVVERFNWSHDETVLLRAMEQVTRPAREARVE